MAIIPEETIKAVLDSTDIVDVIGSYFPLNLPFSSSFRNPPFHNYSTPPLPSPLPLPPHPLPLAPSHLLPPC